MPASVEEVREAWLRACRVDELLSRLDPPPDSTSLISALLERLDTGVRPPNNVLAGLASGLSAPQWAAAGEVVQRQIGLLFMSIARGNYDARLLSELHMEVSAAAASLSLTAWRGQAETDALTTLRNGLGLEADLDEIVQRRARTTVVMLDLDGLKRVNDDQGHDVGDRLIRDFAVRLREEVHAAGGRVYRPHGDEFVATIEASRGDLGSVLQTVADAGFSFSWGSSIWPDADEDIQTVIRQADAAMYEMKRQRKAASAAALSGGPDEHDGEPISREEAESRIDESADGDS